MVLPDQALNMAAIVMADMSDTIDTIETAIGGTIDDMKPILVIRITGGNTTASLCDFGPRP